MKKKLVVSMITFLFGGAIIISACAPAIPHTLDERHDCLECHQSGAVHPYPEAHSEKDLDNSSCKNCHQTQD